MRSKSLQKLGRQVRRELAWPVEVKTHDVPVLYTVSKPHDRIHVIYVPDGVEPQDSDLDRLHELVRAKFCEQIHPVFSASTQFVRQQDNRRYLVMRPALNAACDWFIDQWLFGAAPRLTRQQLRKGLEMAEEVIAEPKVPSLEVLLDAALVIAQSLRYLKEPIECSGPLAAAVAAFQAVPPDKPTLANCLKLVNLLQATYTEQQAELVQEGDRYTWQFTNQPAPAAVRKA